MSIKAYLQDYKYKKHWNTLYQPREAGNMVRKLAKHFKITNFNRLYFTAHTRGTAYYGSGNIKLPKKDIPLAIICHELGHLLAFRYGYKGHSKKTYKYIHRIYKYSIKYIPTEILLELNKIPLLLERR